jgi:putative endonuclease
MQPRGFAVTGGSLAWPAMAADPRQHLGRTGEDLALAHLERLGYELVARNHRTRWGEIDLIVHDGVALVFVEVKTRRASGSGRGPWEALHERKRAQVRRMAAAFLSDVQDRPRATELRFDAIGVVIDPRGRLVRLDHLEGAF